MPPFHVMIHVPKYPACFGDAQHSGHGFQAVTIINDTMNLTPLGGKRMQFQKSRLILPALAGIAVILLIIYAAQVLPDRDSPGQVIVGEDEVGSPASGRDDSGTGLSQRYEETAALCSSLMEAGKKENAKNLTEAFIKELNEKSPQGETVGEESEYQTLLKAAESDLENICYSLACDALLVSDFDTAGAWLERAGSKEDTEYLTGALENAADRVYRTSFTDDSGRTTDSAVSYMWVHSVLHPFVHSERIELLEDFSIGEPDPSVFGSAARCYTQTNQADEYNYVFSYPGSIRDSDDASTVVLAAGFSDDYSTMITKRVYLADLGDAAYAQQRVWELVDDEKTARSVREGFRSRLGIDLARQGHVSFADCVDDRTVPHFCAHEDCLNAGMFMYYDENGRRYYLCQLHHREENEDKD